jgi:hypothetical protein
MSVWDEPVNEGVTEEANPPAPPSEVVDVESQSTEEAQITATEAASEPVATTEDEPKESEQEFRLPKELRDAYDGTKGLRELSKQVGGEDVVKDYVDLSSTLLSQELDPADKAQKLYQSSPKAFQSLGEHLIQANWGNPEWKDKLLQQDFGEGMTSEKVQEMKAFYEQFGDSAPLPEYTDGTPEDAEERLSPATKAKLAKLEDLEKKFPELETKVNRFDELQTQAEAEKITNLGNEFVQEAMSPVVRMMREAGLEVTKEDTPDEKEWKQEVWDTVLLKTYKHLTEADANKPLADDIRTFIESLDRGAAWGKMRPAQARAEREAARLLKLYTSQRQQQRDSATSVLTKDRPPQIPGGSPSFGSTQNLPTGRDAWNDPNEAERWRDIAG